MLGRTNACNLIKHDEQHGVITTNTRKFSCSSTQHDVEHGLKHGANTSIVIPPIISRAGSAFVRMFCHIPPCLAIIIALPAATPNEFKNSAKYAFGDFTNCKFSVSGFPVLVTSD